jgi:hypothetical protein
MPGRVNAITVTAAVAAAAAFGGAYALAHDAPSQTADPLRLPAAIRLSDDTLAELGEARPLPALARRPVRTAPAPVPEQAAPPVPAPSDPVAPVPTPSAPIAPIAPVAPPAPPAPAPTPEPAPPSPPPVDFDDSG